MTLPLFNIQYVNITPYGMNLIFSRICWHVYDRRSLPKPQRWFWPKKPVEYIIWGLPYGFLNTAQLLVTFRPLGLTTGLGAPSMRGPSKLAIGLTQEYTMLLPTHLFDGSCKAYPGEAYQAARHLHVHCSLSFSCSAVEDGEGGGPRIDSKLWRHAAPRRVGERWPA